MTRPRQLGILHAALVLTGLWAVSAVADSTSDDPAPGSVPKCAREASGGEPCPERPLDICARKEGCQKREGFEAVSRELLDWEATVLRSAPVRYPESVAAHPAGEVHLRIYVSRDGKTADVEVVKSLHPKIDAAAMRAVSRYRWSPAFSQGAPVDTIVEHHIRFRPWRKRAPESGLVRLGRSCCVCGL